MKKDYSEYQYTEYDRYRSIRENRKGVKFDFFWNYVRFYPEEKIFRIYVDDSNEYYMMQDTINEEEKDYEKRTGIKLKEDASEEEMIEALKSVE